MFFRDATIDDIDTVFDFVENLWDYNKYDKETVQKELRTILSNPAHFIFLAQNKHDTVGFCHGIIFDTFWMSGKTCYISGIMTREKYRGKGYGIKIMDHAKEIAEESNCRAMILDSAIQRKEAHRFYEKYGFEKSCYGFDLMI